MLKPSFQLNNENYLCSYRLLPSNELLIRFGTKFANSKDTEEDRLNKFKALAYQNQELINNESNLLEINLEDLHTLQWLSGEQFIKPLERKKKGYGELPKKREFKPKMKHNIRQLASAFDKEYEPNEMLFLTFTLPASTLEAYETLSAYSSCVTDLFNKYIHRNFHLKYHRLSVWELQKRGALHLHIIVGSHDPEGMEKVKQGFKRQAMRILDNISEKSKVDMWERAAGGSWRDDKQKLQADAQYVKKSVARYLAKYLSKGGHLMKIKYLPEMKAHQQGQRVSGVWQPFTPVSWSTWNWEVRKLFSQYTKRGNSKRISNKDTNELIEVLGSISDAVCNEAYQKPLIYKDKVGNSFNMRMILNEDSKSQEFVLELINTFLDACEKQKSPIVPEDLFLHNEDCIHAIEDKWYYEGMLELNKDKIEKWKESREREVASFTKDKAILQAIKRGNTEIRIEKNMDWECEGLMLDLAVQKITMDDIIKSIRNAEEQRRKPQSATSPIVQ